MQESRTSLKPKIGLGAVALLFAAALLVGCGGGTADSGHEIETGPLVISATGIGPYRVRGQDNSIEAYGHEASRAELEQAATQTHEYLVARVSKDWVATCALSTPYLRKHIRDVYEFTHPHKPRSCGEMLKTIAPGEPPIADTTREATKVNAGSLRVEGDTGFLFFNAGKNGRKLIVAREGDAWKPAGLLPTPLH